MFKAIGTAVRQEADGQILIVTVEFRTDAGKLEKQATFTGTRAQIRKAIKDQLKGLKDAATDAAVAQEFVGVVLDTI